jgi:hypothetical protein
MMSLVRSTFSVILSAKNIFTSQPILLGRWTLTKNITDIEKKIDWNNYDHCFCQDKEILVDVFSKSQRVSRISSS